MIVELKNVEKMFSASTGIKNINFIINDKDKIGILGPNGSGKTTLIKLIQGLLIPKLGEIIKNGVSTMDKKFSLDDATYISADNVFPKNLSVKAYIKFMKQLNHDYKNNIDEIAKIFEFNLKQRTKIRKLSTGMIQKMKICISLGFEKELYILDEPTNGLDPLMRERFVKYVNNNLMNKTIIYCSHLVEEVSRLCSEVLILKNNTIFERIIMDKNINLIDNYEKIYGNDV